MFDEADLPRRRTDTLAELAREDLDKLSIAELDERIAALEAEIVAREGQARRGGELSRGGRLAVQEIAFRNLPE